MGPKLSVLDLAPIFEGQTPTDTFLNSSELIQHVEKYGYTRYWVAEHHNMEGVASSATAVLIGFLASVSSTIRVGAGGIMLPNHAPIIIAEQFGTLQSIYPNRIDLGLGRAPGTDNLTAKALRRDERGAFEFDQLLKELVDYFDDRNQVKAIPGKGINIPIWLLGSSLYSAKLAGQFAFPFAFASHFSPDFLDDAIRIYYNYFTPSKHLNEPYVIASINAFVGSSDEEGEYFATTLFQQFLNIIRGKRGKSPLPCKIEEINWNEYEKRTVMQTLKYTFYGCKETVQKEIEHFLKDRKINELMVNSPIYNVKSRINSYKLLAELLTSFQ